MSPQSIGVRTAEAELRDGQLVKPERIDDLHMAVEEVSAFIAERVAAVEGADL